MAKIKPSLTYANVVSTLALFLVLVGTGVAATISVLDKGEKKQVRKIVRKQVNKQAGTLSVANATNADNATNATNADNATNAQNAINAQNAAFATELKFFGQPVWFNATTEDIGEIENNSCIDTAPVEADAGPFDHVLGTVNGGDATNPLPSGLTATFLREDGDVTLRLCNPTNSDIPSDGCTFPCFDLSWQFVVLRETSPD